MSAKRTRETGCGRVVAFRGPVVALAVIACCLSAAGRISAAQDDDEDYPHGDFIEDCALCHGDDGWKPARISPEFDHGRLSRFELVGAHRTADCRACHASLVFADAPTDCNACHQDVHLGELGPDCARCHVPRSFIDRRNFVQMHTETRFPLVGSHLAADCEACHTPQPAGARRWVGLAPECETCHIDDYRATTDPDHVNSGFPTDCGACHTPIGWTTARFDHALTGFPLVGAHRGLDCAQCHVGDTFSGTSVDCFSCHQADYERTTNPDHGAAGFPTDCALCHGPTGWKDADFDHALTDFPLTGAHLAVDCTRCHVGGVYTGTPTDCYACHQGDYERTTDPNHVTAGFPTDCAQCHTTSGWGGANFDHDATNFPLTGSHRALDCTACHAGGVYAGTPTDCYACHQGDYERTTDPNHVTAGFPTDCVACHDTSSWAGATFDHDATNFPLTGAHRALDCTACHAGGVYAGTPTDCYACHRDDYERTTDPNHAAAGFPTDCTQCHTTSGWAGANFDHDPWFPIYSGKHRGKWDRCSDCHVQPNNFAVFSCFGCHPHSDRNKTDNQHKDVAGYRYDSQACYSCHPDGRKP
ncbi:MAG: hypothetical protein D6738_04630 [Acidobacteria bacterium]|nr:MAG: hypothetical protein D6738_04630 [Acidobacteriota bacterium]